MTSPPALEASSQLPLTPPRRPVAAIVARSGINPRDWPADQRAEDSAPNKRSCVNENRSATPTCVTEAAHIIPRHLAKNDVLMRCLEFIFNMSYMSFHLDTRLNIVFLGRILHGLFDKFHFGFLPSAAIVEKCRQAVLTGNPRAHMERPDSSEERVWDYTIVPITVEMTTQPFLIRTPGSTAGDEDSHTIWIPAREPRTREVKSHIHPYFAMYNLGKALEMTSRDEASAHLVTTLYGEVPHLRHIGFIYSAWVNSGAALAGDETWSGAPSSDVEDADSEEEPSPIDDKKDDGNYNGRMLPPSSTTGRTSTRRSARSSLSEFEHDHKRPKTES